MAEEANDKAKKRVVGGDDFQSRIKAAMRSRVPYFKEQADSLTLEGVRRLLEKDMGLETRELDSHKRFIRLSLEECLAGGVDENDSKVNAITAKKQPKEEAVESPDGFKGSKDKKEPLSGEEEKLEDSPVMGLLTENKTENEKRGEIQVTDNKKVPDESTIKLAVRERVSYVKANSDKVTMAGFRRLLEEDLKLEKNILNPYKKLISAQLDEALNSYEDSVPADGLKKKNIKNNSQKKASKKERSEESSDSLDSENKDEDENEAKPKRKIATKVKMQNSEGAKKRKGHEREVKESGKKRVKYEDNSDVEESGVSEDSRSQSSAEKPTKKKELPTPVYGKRVEHLKSVIKSCGMSISPAIYKKVKQVPENKREARLIKELEEILAREGLSSNPSEKEIKDVRKRKDRAKELEGIDMNNIVSSSRRRSTNTYVPPPKPPPVVADEDESKDSDSNGNEDDDDSDDEDNDDDEENDGDDEEVEDDEDDDSD